MPVRVDDAVGHYATDRGAVVENPRQQRAIGATDSKAETVKENPKSPQDVIATMYRHLGVDISVSYPDHAGRPHPVLPFGQAIDELF